MAKTITDDARSGVTAAPNMDPLTKARYGEAALPASPSTDAHQFSRASDMLAARMPHLVKGAGFVGEGGNAPLTNQGDILSRAAEATVDLRTEIHRGYHDKRSVVKSFKPDFLNQFGALQTALEAPSIMDMFSALPGGSDVAKSFTAGNLGISGAISGLVPSR